MSRIFLCLFGRDSKFLKDILKNILYFVDSYKKNECIPPGKNITSGYRNKGGCL